MSYLKRQEWLVILSALVAVTGCTTGLDAGSIEKSFTGIKKVTVTGPESVQVNWDTNSGCAGYGVYRLGSDTDSNKIADATVPPYTVKAPNVESERSYSFAVGCNKAGKVQGLSIMQNVTTWPKFGGLMVSSIDSSGQKPVVVLKWDYSASSEVVFDLYVQSSPLPNSKDSWLLNRSGGVGSSYTDVKHCSVQGNQIRLGEGSCSALTGGQGYMFKIVAHYPDGTYSTDFAGSGTYIDVPPPFAAPDCILTSSGIGADPSTSSLFLRCSTDVLNVSCPAGTMTTHAYQGVAGVRISVSDTLTGAGTLRLQPQVSASQLNDRSVEGLELEYVCTSPGQIQKSTVRYDGNPVTKPDGTTFTPIKPVLKFASTDFVRAPNESKTEIPSYFGKAVAIGDFNCDGKPDLAVGMPDVTFNQYPYFSKNPNSGAVVVYYDYVQNADGSISTSAGNTQYISFSDLPAYARFGTSLSAGNVNKDYVLRPDGNTYSCDDLVIGAPGDTNNNATYYGEAYIFYGHPQKFSQPANLSTLTVNDSSCHGSIDSSVCDPVRLKQDMQTNYKIDPAHNLQSAQSGVNKSSFGYSVAYVRDFNADGYGDIAIGDPNCNWDGEVRNGRGSENAGSGRIWNVGCVFVYWGGPNGLQQIDVGYEPGTSSSRLIAPFVKVYPPILQAGMHFGYSVAGGGDIDGRPPVPNTNNAGNVLLANGNDFVVGAPDFLYSGSTASGGPFALGGAWSPFTAGVESRDPAVMDGEGLPFSYSTDQVSQKMIPPLNGAWTTVAAWGSGQMPVPGNAKLASSTGIAFAYLGRSSLAEYPLSLKSGAFYRLPDAIDTPTTGLPTSLNLISASTQSRQNGSKGFTLPSMLTGAQPIDSFYNCGTRGAPGGLGPDLPNHVSGSGSHKHLSCLAGRNNVSWIFPQLTSSDNPVTGFGSNVSIAGPKEQNGPALIELGGDSRIQNATANNYQRQLADGSKFVGYAQGNIHERILGDSLWEAGIHTATYKDATTMQLCEHMNGPIADYSSATYTNQTCANVRPVRSAIKESYSGIPGITSPPDGNIQADINRDGYADVIVTSDSGSVYTFFGNYAADFAYASTLVRNGVVASPYSTSTNCVVTNSANAAAVASDIVPFQTFSWTHALETGSAYQFTSIHPVRPMNTVGGYAYRMGYLGDNASAGAWSYGNVTYPAAVESALKTCLPQKRNYITAPASIQTADLNDDHIVDGVIGFPAETSSTGMARALLSNSSGGGGLGSEFIYNSGAGNYGRAGTGVAATHWRYLKTAPDSFEMVRRDLFMGAPYQNRGDGAVLGYSGYNGAQLATGSPTTLTFSLPIPSALQAEESMIIGDVNGDGYDDIMVPVKRLDARGSIYYDAIIYFGSVFGPITSPMCLAKQTSIVKSNGSGIAASDCNASVSGMSALMASTPIRLPQYYNKPSGMSSNWIQRVQPAGDINGDGRADLYVVDYDGSTIYALYGSDIGLMSGSPSMGPSANKTPQIVTQNPALISYKSVNPLSASSAYVSDNRQRGGSGAPTGSGVTMAHGDFNGDGYEDVAFGIPNAYSYQMSNGWKCNPVAGSFSDMSYCGFQGTVGSNTYNVVNPINGRFLDQSGLVFVMYGGPQGIQTPINGSGTAVDFDYDRKATCDSFYHNCKRANNNSIDYGDGRGGSQSYGDAGTNLIHTYSRMVYGTISQTGITMNINAGSLNPDDIHSTVAMDTDNDKRRPACVPGSGARAAAICVATEIPSPMFYNVDNSYATLSGMAFGSSLTVADVNSDGVDDLIIGQPQNYAAGSSQYNTLTNPPIGAPTSDTDPAKHGAAFIYYGATGFGLLAPTAENMIGNQARGIDLTGGIVSNKLVYQIYPTYDSAHKPTLDPTESYRNFGMTMTGGDFNGDGQDDLAIASSSGTVYVYYGPICQWDSSSSALGSGSAYSMYMKPNLAIKAPTMSSQACQTVKFNVSSDLAPTLFDVVSKPLNPQMIQIAGLAGNEWMGTTLISARKGHGSVKNPGNGTGQTASDLIIAGPSANDPNASTVSYKYTGLGYAFFGHKAGDPLFNTKGGLYISNASYNSSITQVNEIVGSDTISYFYYSPIILRPHSTDATTGRFFVDQVTAGDLNGDARMDLLMPTSDLDKTQDGTDASYGGGFRLFY
jgi:hypothetical protein